MIINVFMKIVIKIDTHRKQLFSFSFRSYGKSISFVDFFLAFLMFASCELFPGKKGQKEEEKWKIHVNIKFRVRHFLLASGKLRFKYSFRCLSSPSSLRRHSIYPLTLWVENGHLLFMNSKFLSLICSLSFSFFLSVSFNVYLSLC